MGAGPRNTNAMKHGHVRTCEVTGRRLKSPTYVTWEHMKQRCHNPNSDFFSHYGARGIEVCERWRTSFTNVLADMGERPEGKSLDRIDVNGPYAPGNCQWATQSEQNLNRRNSRRNKGKAARARSAKTARRYDDDATE
jgi:hypothetical protein